jgi:hypothetical protein
MPRFDHAHTTPSIFVQNEVSPAPWVTLAASGRDIAGGWSRDALLQLGMPPDLVRALVVVAGDPPAVVLRDVHRVATLPEPAGKHVPVHRVVVDDQ